MSRLHVYTVHINPSLREPYESAEFVEEGFNWKAFVFSSLWLLYYRLWWKALLVVTCSLGIWYITDEKMISHAGSFILGLGLHLLVGFNAMDWLRAKFKHQGYITADIVTGNSLLSGQQRFFERYFSTHAAPPFVA